MDIKNKIILEVIKAEKCVQLHLDHDVPLGVIHDALIEFITDIVKRINDAAPKPAPAAEPAPEVAPVVEAQPQG